MDSQTNLDQRQTQANINKRLDGMAFKKDTTSNFNAHVGEHKAHQVSFVTGDDSDPGEHLYKGDTRISFKMGDEYYIILSEKFS